MSANKIIYDLGIIGGGIVGLATARQVATRHPKLKICVFEKENELSSHQSKRNSGVVHQGIYYKKGSLKSKFCLKGARQTLEYCRSKNLPYNQCGKLIVATNSGSLSTLNQLFVNAKENDVQDLELVSSHRINEIQPGCNRALEAIWSPRTAIVNWQQVAWSFAADFERLGGTVIKNFTVTSLKPCDNFNVLIVGNSSQIECRSVINCAGLFSDYFASKTGNDPHPKVVPFKGKYYHLNHELAKSIKTNIYPVPDPKLPFLGVHVTPRLDGSVIVGPTANLCLGYESYDSSFFNPFQSYQILFKSGLSKMLRKKEFRRATIQEIRKVIFKSHLVEEVKELLPQLEASDLIDNNFCGIRAQTVTSRGAMVDDFLFETGLMTEFNRVLHVRNCPSPAATSALAISERITDILEERLI